jgi:nucleoside triphosphate diphosphatase
MTPVEKLIDILRHLRTDPEGCAWSKEQTHHSLIPSLIEESYETADTIDQDDLGDNLRDELGDLLLQIAFHAQIADERKAFDFDGVAQSIVDKLTRRYPTILGDEPNTLKTPEEIDRRWEEVKAQERKAKGDSASVLDGMSRALPALLRASKLKGRMAKAGWEWPNERALLAKVSEEVAELQAEIDAEKADRRRIAQELGDLLFLLADFGRWHGVDAEDALREANNRVETRFRHMEAGLKIAGKDVKSSTSEERRALWDEAKARE